MKRRYTTKIVTLLIMILVITACQSWRNAYADQTNTADVSDTNNTNIPMITHELDGIQIEATVQDEVPVYDFDSDEVYLLTKIAIAEAEGEDIEGKALVIRTVLNRVESDEFPDTIYDVIYQKKQFSPISDGRFNRVEPNEDCYSALDMVVYGWDESEGCMYFENCRNKDNWLSRNLTFLFKHGSHRFYK